MATPPLRRWFQYRLSTWFVLCGIAAWTMAEWPWIGAYRSDIVYTFVKPVYEIRREWNRDLIYPAVALALFLGVKAIIRIRRRWGAEGSP